MSGKGQAPIKLKTGSSLETEGTAANVATNTAAMEALRSATVDGKDIRPRTTTTEHLSASDAIIHGAFKSGSLMVGGGGVVISSDEDGAEPNTGLLMSDSVFSLIKNGVTQVLFDGETGNASFKGAVYAESGSFPGSLVTGNISVGSGGVTISNDGGASGIYIGGNQIYAKASGVVKFLLNGATGEITASKFNLTADSTSQVILNQGTHIFSDQIQVGTSTLGGMKTATQNAHNAANAAQETANNAYNLAAGKTITFRQANTPSALAVGDLWIDTDDNNKLYYATSTGTGGWVEVTDARIANAILDSPYVDLNAQNQITNIDLNGITVGTATSGQRVQINSTGVGCYNSSGTLKTFMDIYGFHCRRGTSTIPKDVERVSFETSAGAMHGFVCGHNDTNGGLIVAGYQGKLHLYGGLNDNGSNWSWQNYATEIVTGGDLRLFPGAIGGGALPRLVLATDLSWNGPTITWGSGSPTSSEPVGSIYLSTGGSFWIMQTGGWRRIDNWVS